MSEPIEATKESLPFIVMARRMIEEDSGGALIGTVYPGEALDLEKFTIPDKWTNEQVCLAEVALMWLYVCNGETAFYNFCCGEQGEVDKFIADNNERAVKKLRVPGDLLVAHKFLNDYFNGWED